MEEHVRASVIISGRVQGVFFRMETQRAAERYGVKGWVKNRSDGTVEAQMEGDKPSVASLIQWCHQGPAWARVDHVEVSWQKYSGEHGRFEVTY